MTDAPIWRFWLLLALTFIVGIFLISDQPDRLIFGEQSLDAPQPEGQPTNRVRVVTRQLEEGLGEALVIAVLLAAIVDPYAKFRLGQEIGAAIATTTAEAAVGGDLPIALRRTLDEMRHITFYLPQLNVDVLLERPPDHPQFMRWITTMDYDVANASLGPLKYKHRAAIMDSQTIRGDGIIREVSHYENDIQKYRLDAASGSIGPMCNKQNGVTTFVYPNDNTIPPTRTGNTSVYRYYSITERLVAEAETQVIQVSWPTVRLVLTVRHPPEITVYTSLELVDGIPPATPEGTKPGEAQRWTTNRALLSNEHIWLHYQNPDTGSHTEA
jgi:hypothetical protein